MGGVHEFLIRRRLLGADGVPVEIEARPPRAGFPQAGRWRVNGDRFFVESTVMDAPAPRPSPLLANLRLDLPLGVHHLVAWLQPAGEGRWEALPHDSVSVEQRRTTARIPVDLPVRFGLVAEAPERAAVLHDISATGLSFDTDADVTVGSECVFDLAQVGGARFELLAAVRGRVVRRIGPPDGFRFGVLLQTTPEERTAIYGLLAKVRRAPAPPGLPAVEAQEIAVPPGVAEQANAAG